MLMPDAIDPKDREILFIRETNEQNAIWEGQKLSKERAREISGIERIEWTHRFEDILHRIVPQADHLYLSTNEHLRATVVVETRNARFIKECQARYPLHHYERLAPLTYRLRMIKDSEEIRLVAEGLRHHGGRLPQVVGICEAGCGRMGDRGGVAT